MQLMIADADETAWMLQLAPFERGSYTLIRGAGQEDEHKSGSADTQDAAST